MRMGPMGMGWGTWAATCAISMATCRTSAAAPACVYTFIKMLRAFSDGASLVSSCRWTFAAWEGCSSGA